MIDAAIEQGRVAHRELKRRDRNALAKADGHGFEWPPAGAGCQRTAALPKLNLRLVEEAHLLEPRLLPLCPEPVGDLGHADVGAFHHDFGDRALAAERVRVVDEMAVSGQRLGQL